MNKARITGLLMLIIGAGIFLIFGNDNLDFIIGFLVGGGLILLITGSFGTKRKW
jgi:multisubunit Na+/H+ antiporter MnhC subunit